MVNNYEAPEVFDLAKPMEVILGIKGFANMDPETGEFDFDDVIDEQFM